MGMRTKKNGDGDVRTHFVPSNSLWVCLSCLLEKRVSNESKSIRILDSDVYLKTAVVKDKLTKRKDAKNGTSNCKLAPASARCFYTSQELWCALYGPAPRKEFCLHYLQRRFLCSFRVSEQLGADQI